MRVPGKCLFGGRLPDKLLATGVLDDDVSHFATVVLAHPDFAAALAV